MRHLAMRYRMRSNRQQGSLFIMVLLVLLIMTGVALSLMFVTDVEMQLGSTERVMTQTFYGAESGLHAALSGLPNQSWTGEELVFVDTTASLPNQQLGTRVITSRIHAIGGAQDPPMSMANEGDNQFHTFSIAVRSVSERVGWPDSERSPIYEKDDIRENDVIVQSSRSVLVRYLVSPVRTPASGEEPYDPNSEISF